MPKQLNGQYRSWDSGLQGLHCTKGFKSPSPSRNKTTSPSNLRTVVSRLFFTRRRRLSTAMRTAQWHFDHPTVCLFAGRPCFDRLLLFYAEIGCLAHRADSDDLNVERRMRWRRWCWKLAIVRCTESTTRLENTGRSCYLLAVVK